MREARTPVCILLDLAAVSGCDFSAIDVLRQFARSTVAAGTTVVVCAASDQLEASLRSHLGPGDENLFRFERDLDHGLEAGEDAILAKVSEEHSQVDRAVRGRLLDRVAGDLERHLTVQIMFEELLEQLESWLEPRAFALGERLTDCGVQQDGAHFLVSGRASVYDSEGRRLYQCGPGDVLEPWAAFSEHIAAFTTIAQTPCLTMLLEPTRRELLEMDDNELTLRLFAFLIRSRTPPGSLFPQTDESSSTPPPLSPDGG